MRRVQLKLRKQYRTSRRFTFVYEGTFKEGARYVAWSVSSLRQYAKRNGIDWDDMRVWKGKLGAISHKGFWLVPIDRNQDRLSPRMRMIFGVDTLREFMAANFDERSKSAWTRQRNRINKFAGRANEHWGRTNEAPSSRGTEDSN